MTPEEANAQLEQLAQRRAIANAMLQQSVGAPSDWGKDRYAHSPWELVANLAGTYLGAKNVNNIDSQTLEAQKARQAEIAQALSQYEGSSNDPAVGPQGRLLAQRTLENTAMGPEQMAQAKIKTALTPKAPIELGAGATLLDPRTYKPIATNAKPESVAPLDELAKLNADHAAGRISDEDYKARRVLMTTRAPQLGAVGTGEQDEIDNIGKATANYQLAPPSGGNRSPRGAAILAAALKYNPNYQAQEYESRKAAYKAFASGKQGDQVRSFNVAISHLNTADDLIDALANGDTVAFNKLSQLWKQQTGESAPTDLATARSIIRGEVVKSISGAGGGQEDRATALAGLADGASAAQMHGSVNVAKRLMGGQLGGLKRQFERSTGRTDFEAMLSPDALPFLGTPEAKGDEKNNAQTFSTEAEAAAARLKPGTRVIINGVAGTWQ